MINKMLKLSVATLLVLAAAQAAAQDAEVRSEHLRGSVHVLYGAGGNIAVSAGEDGVFMVDDQYAPMSPKILAALAKISGQPLRFVLNTHWHGDHTGGNENMGKQGALIVAHENVRKRMSSEQFMKAFGKKVPPSPKGALPVVTFNSAVSFHLNGDSISAEYLGPAHTDGDSLVYFEQADVLHMGDTFFNGLYPFIDVSSGGNVDGVLAAVDRALAMAGSGTRIIPGHGPVTDRRGLKAYRAMLQDIRDRVAAGVAQGKSLAEIQALKPTAQWDEKWGGGFLKPDVFVQIVYDTLPR